MQNKINEIIISCLACEESDITPDKDLFMDLYVDSLALADIIFTTGECFCFEFTEDDIDMISTVESIYHIVAKKTNIYSEHLH
ncbi:Acyl carrier protein [Serratia fonticola]|uniref:acyl carrier protein n=1 Tax=Serratia fonticola TaxID=47917 RepID=UPI00046424B4|nr:phosphopantetheine-binding protein [Serratia fonticola]CAI1685597.1 Acyl carrier protein [Serratia fonticola]